MISDMIDVYVYIHFPHLQRTVLPFFQAIRAAHVAQELDVEVVAEAAGLQPPRAQTAWRFWTDDLGPVTLDISKL